MSEHPSRFELEAFSAGEGTAAVKAHLESCLVCRRVLIELEAERERFLAQRPFSTFAPQLELKSTQFGFTRRKAGGFAAVAMAACLAMLLLPEDSPKIRTKGGLDLIAVRLRDGQQTRHRDQVPIQAGDALRFVLHLTRPAQTEAYLEVEGGSIVPLAQSPTLKAGRHELIDDALRVEPPVQSGTLKVHLRFQDSTVKELSIKLSHG